MTPEFAYLASLTRAFVLAQRPIAPPPATLNWSRFLQLCTASEVLGTLLPMVPRDHLDAQVAADLDDAQRRPTEAAILNLLFLEQMLPRLEDSGCRPIVLKGGVLASLYYPQPEQRYLADLDILVEADQVGVACTVLRDLGLDFTHTRADPRYYRDHHFHWIMNSAAGFVVEVHWDLTLPRSIWRFDLAGLRDRSESLLLNRTPMRVLSVTDQLLHTVIQCTEGGFREMRRLIDAAFLFRVIKDHDALVRQAKVQNQGVALWLVLVQTACWTGIAVPKEVLRCLAPSDSTARILRRLACRMLCGKGEFRHYADIVHLLQWLCASTPRLRWQVMRQFLSPGAEYWLESGYSQGGRPGLGARIRFHLSRWFTLSYLAGVALSALRAGPICDSHTNA